MIFAAKEKAMYHIPRNFTITAFLGILLVYIVGLIFPDIMEVDAAQYGSLSFEMSQTGSYLQVFHFGQNYLDKPPLLFWLSALFYEIFNSHHFFYRLPSFLSTVLGVFATYKLAKHLYNENTGILSALFIASSQVYFLHNHDVRTDTLLTNFVIVALWQGVMYINTHKTTHFIFAFIAVGMAMLAKGPIGAIVPVMAIGTHLLYHRDWKNLFSWRWILGILIVLVILSPMLWGLYNQFDLKPEQEVLGRTGVSGLYFYFWEQSFGRITGENVWQDDSSYFFFTHNYLWEFLPWSLIGILGLWDKFAILVKDRFKPHKSVELYTLGGFIFPFIALSTSHYKLPHYIMVIMPMAAIFTAAYVDKILSAQNPKMYKILTWTQFVFSILIGFLVLFIIFFIFPANTAFWWIVPIFIFTIATFSLMKTPKVIKLLAPSLVALIGANLVMNGYFYPSLNEYQAGKKVIDYVHEKNINDDDFYLYHSFFFNTYYYGQFTELKMVNVVTLQEKAKLNDIYLFTSDKGIKELKHHEITYHVEKELFNFPNTELTFTFLNPATRSQALTPYFLVRVEKTE
jgi:4-amino-4-deoxy-L-arabinose transferase-like glycosyltransferase